MDENIQTIPSRESLPRRALPFMKIVVVSLLIILPIIGFAVGMHYQKQSTLMPVPPNLNLPITKTPSPLSPSPSVTDPQTSDESWKTYANEQYGFSFDHPSNMYIEEGQGSIVKISTSERFEKDELALVIEINTATFDKDRSIDSNEQIVEKDLRLSEITQNTGLTVGGSFFGNPPWSYYSIYFHKSGSEFVEFKIRIHSFHASDLVSLVDTYRKLTTQMLSSFKLLDKKGPQMFCEEKNGVWDSQHKECTNVSKEVCSSIGGKFFDCASRCRHNPKYPDVICIKICDTYCQL